MVLNGSRVWDFATGSQRYQFSSPEDRPTCVVFAPPKQPGEALDDSQQRGARSASGVTFGRESVAGLSSPTASMAAVTGPSAAEVEVEAEFRAGRRRHLIGGYSSGFLRVFDVPTTQTLFEFHQHRDEIQQVLMHEIFQA